MALKLYKTKLNPATLNPNKLNWTTSWPYRPVGNVNFSLIRNLKNDLKKILLKDFYSMRGGNLKKDFPI